MVPAQAKAAKSGENGMNGKKVCERETFCDIR